MNKLNASLATEPPLLETARLLLMPHLLEDFEAQTDMWADPEVVRHISGKPSSPTDSWMRLIRYRGLWPMLGFGYWAVREKASGAYVGDIGFADFHRDIQPSIRGIPEAGWILARWAHGRGYATEALRKACSWLDEQTSFEKSVCIVTPGHAASIRVAEKTGYTEPQSATIRGEPCLLLARRRRKEPAPPRPSSAPTSRRLRLRRQSTPLSGLG